MKVFQMLLKKSFEIQGGKIDNHLLKILEKNDKFKNAIKLRKYEDISKSHNNTNFTINIDYIKNLYINLFIKCILTFLQIK